MSKSIVHNSFYWQPKINYKIDKGYRFSCNYPIRYALCNFLIFYDVFLSIRSGQSQLDCCARNERSRDGIPKAKENHRKKQDKFICGFDACHLSAVQ